MGDLNGSGLSFFGSPDINRRTLTPDETLDRALEDVASIAVAKLAGTTYSPPDPPPSPIPLQYLRLFAAVLDFALNEHDRAWVLNEEDDGLFSFKSVRSFLGRNDDKFVDECLAEMDHRLQVRMEMLRKSRAARAAQVRPPRIHAERIVRRRMRAA